MLDMQYRLFLKIAWCLLTSVIQTTGQSHGREFVLTFLDNLDAGTLKLTISALSDADVTITNDFYSINHNVFIVAGKSQTITLPATIAPSRSVASGYRAIYIKSSTDVSVYAFNFCDYSSSSFSVLPIHALGTRYYIVSFIYVSGNDNPTFSLVATADNTTISIWFRIANKGKCGPPAMALTDGLNYIVALGKYEDFTLYCTGDPTGTSVSSNKPIAVVSGHIGSKVPAGVTGRDAMAEMLPPTDMYGKRYVLHGPANNRGAVFRILGSDNDTDVVGSDGNIYNIDVGDFLELDLGAGDSLCLQTTNPVMVMMFGKGALAGPNNYGDPFMINVPPVELFGNESQTYIAILNTSLFDSSLSLVMKSFYTNTLGSQYDVQDIPSCLYSVATRGISNGRIDISLPLGISYLVSVFSYAPYEGNGFSLGQAREHHKLWEECTSNPCLHNGTCKEDLFSYTCTCVPGYHGHHCQETSSSSAMESSSSFELAPTPTQIWSSTHEEVTTSIPVQSHSPGITSAGSHVQPPSPDESCTDISSQLSPHVEFLTNVDLQSTVVYISQETVSNTNAVTSTPILETDDQMKTSASYSTHLSSFYAMTTSISTSLQTIMVMSLSPSTNYKVSYSQNSHLLTDSSTMQEQSTSTFEASSTYYGPISVTSPGQNDNATTTTSSSAVKYSTVAPTEASCPCKCPANYTDEEMPGLIKSLQEDIQTSLQLDKTVLSKTVRERTSAPDDRPSATYMGGGAIAVLVSIFVVFIVTDLVKIIKDLVHGVHPT